MVRKKAFTLIELLVVISIIALLIGILLPALGAARRNAQRMENNTRLRGIHQGAVQYAQGNDQKFPGLGADETSPPYGWSSGTAGDEVYRSNGRLAILWQNNYFTADFIISPLDSKTEASTNITESHYSYAALQLNPSGSGNPNLDARRAEWGSTANSEGTAFADRNGDQDPELSTLSIHVSETGAYSSNQTLWRGGVCWNDNHVTFETSGILERTRHGSVPGIDDDLFAGASTDPPANMAFDTAEVTGW